MNNTSKNWTNLSLSQEESSSTVSYFILRAGEFNTSVKFFAEELSHLRRQVYYCMLRKIIAMNLKHQGNLLMIREISIKLINMKKEIGCNNS